MRPVLTRFYALLCTLSALAMAATFVVVMLGIVGRETGWFNLRGLDAYAGYSIAAALFLALPETLRRGDHIRVTLLLQRLPERPRRWLETWCLGAGVALALYLAWFACRLVWTSQLTHDVSPSSDATPLWIPQLAMALGCVGLAVALADALACHASGRPFFDLAAGEAAHVE
ncbi:MAG: TRAP transporter small permease [Burkholderiales bacterium]|nr:TRAP transporter small permease [Burkholderiales bacterium]